MGFSEFHLENAATERRSSGERKSVFLPYLVYLENRQASVDGNVARQRRERDFGNDFQLLANGSRKHNSVSLR